MKSKIINCDHCGKVISEFNDAVDCVDSEFGFAFDLCTECYHKLSNNILEFISAYSSQADSNTQNSIDEYDEDERSFGGV